MKNWEYITFYSASYSNVVDELNELGASGWELVDVVNGWFCLKRELVEPAVKEPEKPAKLETSLEPVVKTPPKKASKKPAKKAAKR
jgi:hypothetical protein